MAVNERLNELLLSWEEHRQSGRTPALADLCRDCPELIELLSQKIQALEAMNPFLRTPDGRPLAAKRQVDNVEQTPLPPPMIPGYQVICEVGRGGMGVVYKARHIDTNRIVALKTIPADRLIGDEDLQRFRGEADAVTRLEHPNIVQIYDVGMVDDRPFFALEYLEGGTLDEKLRGAILPPRTAAQLIAVLARAMHYAHERGVIHRDLKPSNILLARCEPPQGIRLSESSERFQCKIADFGLARRVGAMRMTKTGAILGTPSFMAPEQARGIVNLIGPRTDLHALGAMLYMLLTGKPPYYRRSHLETIRDVLTSEPIPPRILGPDVPSDLDTICLKCLEKDPRRRYATAAELADDLERFLDNGTIVARPAGWARRLWRWLRRNRGDLVT